MIKNEKIRTMTKQNKKRRNEKSKQNTNIKKANKKQRK